MNALEVPVVTAIDEAPGTARRLLALAAAHRDEHVDVNRSQTRRYWEPDAGTFCYQTHIAIDAQPAGRLLWLADVLFNAPGMERQPWYPQFLGGTVSPLEAEPRPGMYRHQLAWGCFDLGLGSPRYYRQLVSESRPGKQTVVITARSTLEGPALPAGARLAYTLATNGEVLHFENDRLHWHHICCTPGAGLLPPAQDRWLINLLRRLKLDGAERRTYREEARQMRDWLQSSEPTAPR